VNKVTERSIVLKRVPYADADWIVTFFSREHGRMSGIAPSARKSLRRFGSGLEPGAITNLTFTARANSDLVRLEESQVLFSTTGMMASLARIEALGKAIRVALSFLKDHQAAPEKFDLLQNFLAHISQSDPVLSTTLAFELKWLALAGFEPSLTNCVSCGCAPSEEAPFSVPHGGLMCPECAQGERGTFVLSSQIRNDMTLLLRMPLGTEVRLNREHAISALLSHYTEHVLGHSLMNG
jgi:DNA repair protein RecO (recombination protein O)